MAGTAFRDGKRWRGHIQIDGVRCYVRGATKREVQARLAELASTPKRSPSSPDAVSSSDTEPASTLTVAQFASTWMAQIEKQVRLGNLRPKTSTVYGDCLRIYIIPRIGQVTLSELNTEGRVVWTGVRVLAQGTVSMSVTVTVNADVAQPGTFTNFVTVGGTDTAEPPADPTVACPAGPCYADTDEVPGPMPGPKPDPNFQTGGEIVGSGWLILGAALALMATAGSVGVLLAHRRRRTS